MLRFQFTKRKDLEKNVPIEEKLSLIQLVISEEDNKKETFVLSQKDINDMIFRYYWMFFKFQEKDALEEFFHGDFTEKTFSFEIEYKSSFKKILEQQISEFNYLSPYEQSQVEDFVKKHMNTEYKTVDIEIDSPKVNGNRVYSLYRMKAYMDNSGEFSLDSF